MRERYAALPLDQIEADPLQPRHELESVDDPTMTEARTLRGLAQSIAEFGILQPIRVRRVSDDDGERYRIVSGQRRYEAAKLAGLETVPTLIEDGEETSGNRLLRQVTENFQRKALTATELALAISSLLQGGATRDEVEQKLGVPTSQVTILLSLLKLSEPVKVAFAQGQIESPRAAYDLNRLPPSVQAQVIAQAESMGRVIGQRDVRAARAETTLGAAATARRFEAPAIPEYEYEALQQVLADGVVEAYEPAADRDAVFGTAWRAKAAWANTTLNVPQASAFKAEADPTVDVPSMQLSRTQVLRLVDCLQLHGLIGAKDVKKARALTDMNILGQRLVELLHRV